VNKLKEFIEDLYFLKMFFSPFLGLKLVFYFGDIKIGHPYFMPRKFNMKEKKYESITRFGFAYNTLGWKTKFSMLRYEYEPSYSIILFGKQFNIKFVPNNKKGGFGESMWEAWLYYYYRTDRKLSTNERLYQLFNQYSCTYSYNLKGVTNQVNNYYYILKKKHIEVYKEWLKDKDPVYKREKRLKELGI
jgi:hypothetical protein